MYGRLSAKSLKTAQCRHRGGAVHPSGAGRILMQCKSAVQHYADSILKKMRATIVCVTMALLAALMPETQKGA